MAMNVSEANAVNTLLRWHMGLAPAGGEVPTAEQARQAAARLAEGAHRKLAAGITAATVHDHWKETGQ